MEQANAMIPMDQLRSLGDIFVKSGFFSDSRDASQAIVKILAGRELGFGPIASMTNVYIVNGRPALSANLIAARIKSSGRYDYRVRELDDKHCSIEFFQTNGTRESLGLSTFTLEDAKRAGTKNTDKFPRNMLFARSLTNGARWYCPDVFNMAIYTPDELGATVDEDGAVLPAETVIVEQATQPTAEPTRAPLPADAVPNKPGPNTHNLSGGNGNGDAPKQEKPKIKTFALVGHGAERWKAIKAEALDKQWALGDTGEVNDYRLTAAILDGGFSDTRLTDSNWEQARDAMRLHYSKKEAA